MSFDWLEMGFAIEKKGESPALFTQVHGNAVLELSGQPEAGPKEADAGFTALPNTEVYVFTADCLPVLVHGENSTAPIGAAHAGWRGAMKGIVSQLLHQMAIPPSQTHVVLGPSIGPCCFEVQKDFIETFRQAGRDITPYLEKRNERLFCNLIDFVIHEELSAIPRSQVSTHLFQCTVCSKPQLPSYRRNKSTDPRIRTWLRKQMG